jgi:2-polyprenyl-6-methoxyphenol hydroxylase-like FAD-dependent oxidoreductase
VPGDKGKLRLRVLLTQNRTGYGPGWGDRQNLLKSVFNTIQDKNRILVNKKVIDVKHSDDGVTVTCDDGSSYRGDLLVGADGIYSKTRQKMWELAEAEKPDLVKEERDRVICDYNCIFGIARGVDSPLVKGGDVHTTYDFGRCALTVVAEHGKVFWFAQEKLDKTYRLSNMPRYTDDDARAFIARHGDLVIINGPGRVTLADLWAKTVSFRLVPIEEAKFQLWHWGRIACTGDCVHKATPNLGQGGNAAIESAAALANRIKRLSDAQDVTGRRPTIREIDALLSEYQKERELRARGVVDASADLTRRQNMKGIGGLIFIRFVRPLLTEFLPEILSSTIIGSVKLDFLPLPKASLIGTQPFNPSQGEGKSESKLKRMLFALPLLAVMVTATKVMDANPVGSLCSAVRDSGVIELVNEKVPIIRSFYQLKGFDDFLALVNTFFYPSMYGTIPAGRRQMVSFITDGAVLQTIWLIEAARRAAFFTPMKL